MNEVKLDEFRFHFKPIKQYNLFVDWDSKNSKLSTIIEDELSIPYRGKYLNFQLTSLQDNKYHIRLANSKITAIEKNFNRTYIDNEPSCNIFIWNNVEEQKIYIESDKHSFNDSKTVANILTYAFNIKLAKYGFELQIRAEIEEKEFWELTERYKGRITEIQFDLLYPNLPAANKTINDEIKQACKSLGSDHSVIAFKAPKKEVLKNVNKENSYIEDLNTATSKQGTPVTIKILGFKAKFKTGKTTKSIEVNGFEVSGDQDAVKTIVDRLFKYDDNRLP